MPRFLIGLVLGICWLSDVNAAARHVAAARESRGLYEHFPATARSTVVRSERPEFVVTEQTEVRLDGRPCKYADIPPSAEILFMEISSNRDRTILKIHFRSKK
ncbi:MAG: hypothetical protein NZ700_11055 [Gemmataceae bacterium]|nr:hypothetical protein [Gemmataceae bacterium]MDW8265526.1 hypothetical protein [Gemmataceae bacterium]